VTKVQDRSWRFGLFAFRITSPDACDSLFPFLLKRVVVVWAASIFCEAIFFLCIACALELAQNQSNHFQEIHSRILIASNAVISMQPKDYKPQ